MTAQFFQKWSICLANRNCSAVPQEVVLLDSYD